MDEVGYIRRKVRIRELTIRVTKAREIETENGNSPRSQSAGDAFRGRNILGACKAVGEECGVGRFVLGKSQPA
jgi:hypothetical protein